VALDGRDLLAVIEARFEGAAAGALQCQILQQLDPPRLRLGIVRGVMPARAAASATEPQRSKTRRK
jgi:hypothetical protein